MPFKSSKQRSFMYAKHPEIAKRWSKEYGSKPRKSLIGDMPKRKKGKK